MLTVRQLSGVLVAVLLLLAGVLQVVAFKRAGYSLGPYPYFILLSVSLSFVPVLFAMLAFVRFHYGQFNSESTTRTFYFHYSMIGVLSGLNGVFVIFSVPHTSGVMQSLLTQCVIPFTFLLSVLIFRTRYSLLQGLGVCVVLVGTVLTFITGHDAKGNDNVWWCLCFALGQLPLAASSVYQEHAFRKAKVNLVLMMAWSSLAQFVCLVLALPLNWIPGFGGQSPSNFPDYMRDAGKCFANTLDTRPECHTAAKDLSLCVLTMLGTTATQALLVKLTSASVWVLVMTLVTPLSAFAFTLKVLMGNNTEALDMDAVYSLIIITAGIVLFRWKEIAPSIAPCLGGGRAREGEGKRASALLTTPLNEVDEERADDNNDDHPFLAPRLGVIGSEYTSAHGDSPPVSVLYEHTQFAERRRAQAAAANSPK